MIKHIFTIAILQFCFIAKSQEVNFTYGSPITKESISGMEYTDWFYNPAIVGGSQTKVNFLGYFNKHYFIVKNIEDKGHVLLAFAENLKLANAWPLQKFSSVEGISYLDAVVFQNELVFFFNGNSDLVAKGNAGLFMAKFDYNSMKFNNPELVDQFGGAGKVKDLECTISENGQFIALVVNPDANGVNYSYGFVTLDNKLTKIKTESEVTGKFTENHHYHSAFISNKGGLYLLFDDNGESPFGSTGSASTQKPHAHATLIQHNSDGSKSEKFIQLDGRLLLRLKCVDRENGVEVFISWFNEEDENKTGFSFYSPEQGKETFKYEFDQNWVEPYVKRTLAFTLEDLAVKKNQASSTIVNVFFDLKNTIETETDVIYIIKKKTNIAIPGGTTSTPGGTYVNNGSHACLEGDFLIIKQNKNSGDFTKAKIERYGNVYSEGEIIMNKNGKLNFLYCSIMPEAERSGTEAVVGTLPNTGLYVSEVDLNTLEVSTKKIGDYAKKEGTLESVFKLYSTYQDSENFVVFTYSKDHERLVSGSFSN